MYVRLGITGFLGPWSRVRICCSKLPFCQNNPPMYRGVFCHFPFRWIYYYAGSNKSTRKETDKTHLCAMDSMLQETMTLLQAPRPQRSRFAKPNVCTETPRHQKIWGPRRPVVMWIIYPPWFELICQKLGG